MRLDIDEMLEELPSSIFYEWYHHYLNEPWGYEFEIAKHAEQCSYLVNGLFKLKNPLKPADFYPKTIADQIAEADEEERPWQEIKEILKGISNG